MTKSTVCRMHIIGVLAAFGGALLTTSANAGPFEEFQQRCLTPMENVKPVETSELQMLGELDGPNKLSVFEPDSLEFMFLVMRDDAGDDIGCSVNLDVDTPPSAQQDFASKFATWAYDRVHDESYVVLPTGTKYTINLESNVTREPRMRVSLWKHAETNSWIASVRETDLES